MDDSRGTPSAAKSPEKLRVAAFRNLLELAVSSDDLDFDYIIDLHAKLVRKWIVATGLHPTASDADSLYTMSG
jgi:hypothetical protein